MTRRFLCVLSGLVCLLGFSSGCAEKEENIPPAPEMEITVDFQEVHRCSRISPEITVAYAPHGTKFYDVRLMEGGDSDRYLGGGVWRADGTGLIPEGALTRHYMGPCPPADRRVEYVYVVSALEDLNGQPLATRFYRFIPE